MNTKLFGELRYPDLFDQEALDEAEADGKRMMDAVHEKLSEHAQKKLEEMYGDCVHEWTMSPVTGDKFCIKCLDKSYDE